jgi:hypothetical protein
MPETMRILNKKRLLIAVASGVFAAGCGGGDDSTAPALASTSTPVPAGVWHADVDRGALHSVDMDTRFSIGTAELRNCDTAPPGACTVNGTVALTQNGNDVTLVAEYLNRTIFATFTGSYYVDDTLRGTIVVGSKSHSDTARSVTMRRTKS